MGVAKVSFGSEKISENVKAVLDAVVKAKPQSSKGTYLKNIYLSTTMGPSVQVNASVFRG